MAVPSVFVRVAEKHVVKQSIKSDDNPALAEAKKQLRQLNARPSKGLGQNFLIDEDVLKTIASAAELTPDDTVVEVGPGLGILTSELLEKAGTVISVEVDSNLATALRHKFSSNPQLSVVNADILDLDLTELIHSHTPATNQNYKVVANLPYYVASPIIRRFLETSLKPSAMVIMLQKEVGQSIVAGPGHMSLIGIGVQLYGKPSIVDYVPPQSFYPAPKVDSAIVHIDVYPRPAIELDDIEGFFQVVKGGFSTPRKQLRNSLSRGLGLPTTETAQILEQAEISPQRRPQTLSLEEWANVYRVFSSRDIS